MKRLLSLILTAALSVGMFSGTGAAAITAEAAASEPTVKKVIALEPDYELYDMDKDTYTVQVEVGNKFYMGDLVQADVLFSSGTDFYLYASAIDATYKTSKKAVAAVNKSTGLVTPKKKGTATITIKAKGVSKKIKVKVVKAGSFKDPSSKVKKQAAKIAKYSKSFKGTFNLSNAKKMIAAAEKCEAIVEPYYYKDYTNARYAIQRGFLGKKNSDGSYEQTNKLIYPGCAHYYAMEVIIDTKAYNLYNPFATTAIDPIKLKSASASSTDNTITLTLDRKLSSLEYQILSHAGAGGTSNGVPFMDVYGVRSDQSSYLLIGTADLVKNSDTISLSFTMAYGKDGNYYVPGDTTASTSAQKLAADLTTLTKGKTYTLYDNAYFDSENSNKLAYTDASESWTGNISFTVK